jgi:hypothetical protein
MVGSGLLTEVFAVAMPFLMAAHEGPVDLRVYPPEVELSTQRDYQSFVVQAVYADRMTRDVTADAEISFALDGIVHREGSRLLPRSDGETVMHAAFGSLRKEIPIRVAAAAEERPVSFRLDVMPIFLRAGCNTGSCHGSARGQDKFRLSLFGFDPAGDYFRLTRDFNGRRLNFAVPEESLMVQKALGAVPHTGGERFTRDSPYFDTLVRWLQDVAPDDAPDIPEPVSLDVMPDRIVLETGGASQQLTVRAKYSDGTDRDVTDLTVFMGNNDIAAPVSKDGLITSGKRGEAFIMARFHTFSVGSHVVVVPDDVPYVFPDVPEYNYVDTLVYEKLRKLRISPSELCDDEVFLRRATIDLTGRLPTREEYETFAASEDPEKRISLVDTLLTRKEFTELWVMYWAEQLQIRSGQAVSYKSALLYHNWLKEKIASNVPMDQIVRELLSATGGTFKNPPTNYYQGESDTLLIAEDTAQVFMGIRTQCSQCHNHPFDRWTMNDYYGFAAFFARIGRKNTDDPREKIIFAGDSGEVQHPVTKQDVPPKYLGDEAPDTNGKDRRKLMADWLTRPDNPYFARNLANRVWAQFFGRGIVEPVDDVRVSNPASNPELLDELSRKLVEYKYDFKQLVRDICLSRTYQLSTRANESNAFDRRNFARAEVRRIRAEVLLDCITQITETKDKFQGLPLGARAVQIADGNVSTYFLSTFGRSTRQSPCSCEVVMEPSLSQALHLLNGDTTQGKIRDGNVVQKCLDDTPEPGPVIEDLYIRCLTRFPTDKEKTELQTQVASAENPKEALEDLFWALLNSKEFVFNH